MKAPSGDHEILVKQTGLLHQNLLALGPITYTADEQRFAKAIQPTVGIEQRGGVFQPWRLGGA